MPSIFKIISKSGVDVSPRHRSDIDVDDYSAYDHTTESHSDNVFERPRPDDPIQNLRPATNEPTQSILKYFIDGSRRVQKVADIVFGGRFFPMVAGQVGVAVTGRTEDSPYVKPLRDYCKVQNVISLPDKLGQEIEEIQRKLDDEFPIRFKVLTYDTSNQERNPNDLAVIAIMSQMLDMEIEAVTALASSGLLGPNSWLVRDGPLQFRKKLPKISAFQHVIGISKSFSTNAPVKKGGNPMDVGSLVTKLDIFDRTKCYCLEMSDKSVAFWYLRLHPKNRVPNPALDGVIKIEKIAQPWEVDEDGVEADLINTISRHVFNERNVTAYGSDTRWANHIYPVYLTEKFLKASLDSQLKFNGYFRETA
ncbi:MAG: hypothetical protein JSS66_00235 [Armatimonadetes bacterium]|nr:hypothetical protein [Armatimonadota bacterium]